ncbi:MAG TPA: CerR family C-terminal domain-containing protein [Gemmataceae bacterium]|nr:CerR family C-terminal domain-containing protein [Gemmataceae bacterium]
MATKESVPPAADDTRDRLILAAEEVFAAKGFEAASVRDILRRANVKNIAAINYYFGDKERLYIETVKNAHTCCNAGIPFPDWPAGAAPEQKLRDFVHTMLQRLFQPQRPTAFQLMLREMAFPTKACVEVVQEYIRPMAAVLAGILEELLPGLPRQKHFLIGFSIVGQCLHYRQNRAVCSLLMGPEIFDKLSIDMLAEHIAEFTLAAIQSLSHPKAHGRKSVGSRSRT